MRTPATALLIILGLFGVVLICIGINDQGDAFGAGILMSLSSVFALAILQGQESQESILNEILRELREATRQPADVTDEAAPTADHSNR